MKISHPKQLLRQTTPCLSIFLGPKLSFTYICNLIGSNTLIAQIFQSVPIAFEPTGLYCSILFCRLFFSYKLNSVYVLTWLIQAATSHAQYRDNKKWLNNMLWSLKRGDLLFLSVEQMFESYHVYCHHLGVNPSFKTPLFYDLIFQVFWKS